MVDWFLSSNLCYVFTAPSGAAQRAFWRMAAAEGLPLRTIDERGNVVEEGSLVGDGDAEVHVLFAAEPSNVRPKVLPSNVPRADVYCAVGREATLALVSGRLPQRWQSVEDHATSVVKDPHGVCNIPPGALVVPVNMPGFIPQEHRARQAALFGGEEWYPSRRLALRRVRAALDGTLPKAPAQDFTLFATAANMDELINMATIAGGVAIDLETPRGGDAIFVGAFAVGERAWVFDAEGTVEAARRLFALDIAIYGQNHTTFDIPILCEHGVPMPRGPIRDLRWLHAKVYPRMPHDLCHIGTHACPWAPINHKPMSNAAPMTKDQREYCAVDAWLAWWAAHYLEEEFV